MPHGFEAREQTFRGMVGRDLNQRTIQFDPRLAGCTSGLESRNDCACAIQLAAIRDLPVGDLFAGRVEHTEGRRKRIVEADIEPQPAALFRLSLRDRA